MSTVRALPDPDHLLVLVLNEDPDVCQTVARALGENRCSVVCLPLQQRSHLQVRDLNPDLVIIDIAHPDSPGLDILRCLEQQRGTRRLPIIVTSSREALEYELLEVFDFLLKPLDLHRLLEDVEMIRRAPRGGAALPYGALNERELDLFQSFLLSHSGLHFDQRNHKILERGLTHRMRALNIGDFRSYYDYLLRTQETRQELKKLLGLLTIGETFFFRYLAHFDALADRVIPELLLRNRASRTLRIWSAGCSTGEEPYTIAMLLLEHFPQLADWNVSILATDINKRALARARDGVFSGRALRLTDSHYLGKYFVKGAGGFILSSQVRNMVRFSYLNLQTGHYPSAEFGSEGVDILFCRNVMIYFPHATTRSVVERFSRCLRPGGYFFMGHAETLINTSDAFVRQQYKGGFYYRLKEQGLADAAPAPPPTPVLVAPLPAPLPSVPAPPRQEPPVSLPVTPPPVDLAALLQQAAEAFERENFKTASRFYAMILEHEPNHVEALLGAGFILANEGRYNEALAVCNAALKQNDLLADAYFLRGLIFDLQRDLPASVAEYRKALLLDIAFIMPHYNLSKIYWRQGKLEEAQRELTNTVRLLERTADDVLVPHSGGLSRAVFLEICREDAARFAALLGR